MEGILKAIEVEGDIKEVRRIGGGKEGETVLVKTGSAEQKREIMRKKRNLKGRKEIITEDWTWGEKR